MQSATAMAPVKKKLLSLSRHAALLVASNAARLISGLISRSEDIDRKRRLAKQKYRFLILGKPFDAVNKNQFSDCSMPSLLNTANIKVETESNTTDTGRRLVHTGN